MPNNLRRILLLDDNKIFLKLLAFQIKRKLGLECLMASSFDEAKSMLRIHRDIIFLAILDLNIPDSEESEHIDYFIKNNVPIIVVTAELNDRIRDRIISKSIIDYAYKDREEDMQYILNLLIRIQNNLNIKVIVAEDSISYRTLIVEYLKMQKFQVLEAKNGIECLEILRKNPEVKLIITDYNMPVMNGFELTLAVRMQSPRHETAVIGMSGIEDKGVSSKFIKIGANDFISKPFSKEEFFCRINLNIEVLETIEKNRNLANRDFLTGLYNRRYFCEFVDELFKKKEEDNFAIALLDIDFFKKINDTYGHQFGDKVIQFLSESLQKRMREGDIVARFGGEEFCILSRGKSEKETIALLEEIRHSIQISSIPYQNEQEIRFTISIGVCLVKKKSFDEMLGFADELLYKAKDGGRNQVCA